MAELAIPHPQEALVTEDGRINKTWYDRLSALFTQYRDTNRDLASAATGLSSKATTVQKEYGCWTYAFPADGTQILALNLSHAWTITKVTTKTGVGTSTCTVKIDGVALGGTANSASTSQQEQAHTTANAAAAGTDVTVTFASTSGDCADLTIAVEGTRTLATS